MALYMSRAMFQILPLLSLVSKKLEESPKTVLWMILAVVELARLSRNLLSHSTRIIISLSLLSAKSQFKNTPQKNITIQKIMPLMAFYITLNS
mgnify:CR=1 FL=1